MRKLKNNKGFSLVELLLVVSIMMIIMAVVSFSYRMVSNANVSKAAQMLASDIREARTTSMSKGMTAGELKIYMRDGSLYTSIGGDGENKISNRPIEVSGMYSTTYSGLSGGSLLGDGTEYVLRFGASGSVRSAGASNTMNVFFLTNGSKKVEVLVYLETGKVYVFDN